MGKPFLKKILVAINGTHSSVLAAMYGSTKPSERTFSIKKARCPVFIDRVILPS